MENSITEVFTALNEIESVGSTNAKKAILQANAGNTKLQYLLKSAYDPYTQFYIKKIPTTENDCKGDNDAVSNYNGFTYLLEKLSRREITGNNAIERLSKFLKSCSSEEYKWYSRVIKKDLKIGIADKGINAVIKNLIPTYEVMLADKITPNDLENKLSKAMKIIPNEFYLQPKLDGFRLNIWVHEDGRVETRTRNGKLITGYNALEEEAKEKLPRGYVYDGEVLSPEFYDWIESNKNNTGVTANRELFSEVMSHAFSKENDKKGIFNLFDMVPINEWTSKNTIQPYSERLQFIVDLVAPIDLENVRIVKTYGPYRKVEDGDLVTLLEKFREFLRIGYEGIMIKDKNSVYEFKRSKALIKMKQMDNLDLPVIELFEGEGKYREMLGGVYVDYKGYKVGVGSGWTDEQRMTYWKNPNLIIGKTIEVKYQAESKNKQGGLSLSFPVVVGVRNDK